jgi:hypothetical protein
VANDEPEPGSSGRQPDAGQEEPRAKEPTPEQATTDEATPDEPPPEELTPEEKRFVEGLVARGEAAEPVEGELPDPATHEIVERPEGRPPVIKRRRFTQG